MIDINRKQMKDVMVPQNDVVRRPATAPLPYIAPLRDDEGDRIGKNPFFEKPRNKDIESQKTKGRGLRGILWALLFAVLLAVGFFTANYFATATIEITPITRNTALHNNLRAFKESTEGELTFQFMSLAEEKIKEVPATIEKKIQKKASGKVVIYNEYNGESQRLVINTRLESPDHKIFRIEKSVVVPGAIISGGRIITPGSVEVTAYADIPGEAYNIGLSDFTIPGFKGDPRFTKFKVRSATSSPISGGYSGTVKVPSDEAVAQARKELDDALLKESTEKARAQVPPNVSFFPGSMIIKFEEVPQDFTTENTAKVSERATVSVFFFDTAELAKKIALLSLPEDKNNPFLISNMPTLKFEFIDRVDNVVLSDLSKISFSITGIADFVGQIDAEKIRTELIGKNKKDFSKIIENQINISNANAVIRPMWKSVFPSDSSKIKVKIITK